MTFEESIFNYLSNESTLTTLIDKKIYPDFVPETSRLPLVMYELSGSDEGECEIQGNFGVNIDKYIFNAYGKTKSETVAIYNVLRTLFLNYVNHNFGNAYDLQLCKIASKSASYYDSDYIKSIEIKFIYTEL